MADTVKEKIVENVVTTLKTITTGNGYNNAVGNNVFRPQQHGSSLLSMPQIQVVEGAIRRSEESPYGVWHGMLALDLECTHVHATSDSRSTDEINDTLYADVLKALAADRTRGGNAIDTKIQGMQPLEINEENRQAGVIVDVEIEYRHAETDATVAI